MIQLVVAQPREIPTGIHTVYLLLTRMTHTILGVEGYTTYSQRDLSKAQADFEELRNVLLAKYGDSCLRSNPPSADEVVLLCGQNYPYALAVGLTHYDHKIWLRTVPDYAVSVFLGYNSRGIGRKIWADAKRQRDRLRLERARARGAARGL